MDRVYAHNDDLIYGTSGFNTSSCPPLAARMGLSSTSDYNQRPPCAHRDLLGSSSAIWLAISRSFSISSPEAVGTKYTLHTNVRLGTRNCTGCLERMGSGIDLPLSSITVGINDSSLCQRGESKSISEIAVAPPTVGWMQPCKECKIGYPPPTLVGPTLPYTPRAAVLRILESDSSSVGFKKVVRTDGQKVGRPIIGGILRRSRLVSGVAFISETRRRGSREDNSRREFNNTKDGRRVGTTLRLLCF